MFFNRIALIVLFIIAFILFLISLKGRSNNIKYRSELTNSSDFVLRNKDLIERIIKENAIVQGRHSKQLISIIILVCFIVLGIVVAFISDGKLIFVSIILLIIGIVNLIIFNNSYQNRFKNMVIDKIINVYNSNFEYYPNDGFSHEEYNLCHFPEVCDIYSSEDLIIDHNSSFRYADILIESKTEDSDGHTYIATEYSGSLAFINIKDCHCEIYLGGMKKDSFIKNFQHIKFENDTFNDLFCAYSTNELEAYKILTPDVMEQFVHLKENTYGDIDIRLLNNKLYIRFLSGDGFVPALFNKKRELNSIISSLAVLEEVVKVMNNVKNLIEKIDLS